MYFLDLARQQRSAASPSKERFEKTHAANLQNVGEIRKLVERAMALDRATKEDLELVIACPAIGVSSPLYLYMYIYT